MKKKTQSIMNGSISAGVVGNGNLRETKDDEVRL